MSLAEILNTIEYDLTFANGIVLHGNLDYVSEHFGDDIVVSNKVSKNQSNNLQPFVNELFNYNKTNNTDMSITDFYDKIWTKKGE